MILHWLRRVSRFQKKSIMIAVDFLLLPLALWLAVSLRFGEFFVPDLERLWLFVAAPMIAMPIFIKMGMYRAVVHYMEMKALWTVIKSVSLAVLIWSLLLLMLDPHGVPRSSVLNYWMLSLLFIGGCRMWMRWLLSPNLSVKGNTLKVAVYGAGSAGVQLLSALNHSHELSAVAFMDDDPELIGHEISGINVYGLDQMTWLIDTLGVQQVLIALPSASRAEKRIVVERLEPYPVEVRMLPGISELAQGTIKMSDIRDVSVIDVLGRESVAPDETLLEKNILDKVVMVTGAGGSIGSELCRQILKHRPSTLVLFEQNEFALYEIEKELRAGRQGNRDVLADGVNIVPILGSVLHQHRIEHVCSSFAVQTIYHAAAYKHVPMVEYNPVEGVQNNVFGTWRAANAAIATGVETFVLISTDKAVRPTNVMGASKRLAELLLQALAAEHHDIRICMVRFGNVLGSSGSVVPLFRKQIKDGGPVTVTHADITRYFMTIPEASQLVIQAGAMGQGGDVFVLDMGESVKIVDLATKMIHLSGLTVRGETNPNGDIEIVFSGLRPGEKLYEELLIGDHVTGTEHPRIMRAQEDMLCMEKVRRLLDELSIASRCFDVKRVRDLLLEGVGGYRPQCDIQDLPFCWNEKKQRQRESIIEPT